MKQTSQSCFIKSSLNYKITATKLLLVKYEANITLTPEIYEFIYQIQFHRKITDFIEVYKTCY